MIPVGRRSANIDDVDRCTFCHVVDGELDGHIVWRDEHTCAFLDRRPVFKGHTLVVPTAHVETLTDLPVTELAPLFGAAQRLAAAMITGLGAQGSFVAINNTVSQSVPHLHVHVVPRTKGDGLRGFFWPRLKYADDTEMAAYAARLRTAVG